VARLSDATPTESIAASAAVVATSLGSFAISRLPFMQSIGVGYLITTLFIVLTVFLILPALLYLLGDRIFWPKKTIAAHRGRSRLLEKAVDTALKKPLLVAVAATLVTLLSFLFLISTLRITANPVVAMPETQYKKALEVATTYFKNVTALSTTYIAMKNPPPPELLHEVEKLPNYVNYTLEKRGDWYIVAVKLSLEDTSDKLLDVYRRLDQLRAYYGPYLIGGAASWKNVIFNEIYVKFWSLQIYVVIATVVLILAFLLKSFLIPLRLVATVLMSIVWSLAAEVALFQEALGQPTYWLVPVIALRLLNGRGHGLRHLHHHPHKRGDREGARREGGYKDGHSDHGPRDHRRRHSARRRLLHPHALPDPRCSDRWASP
jgi:RND superfamily putative drug exporter